MENLAIQFKELDTLIRAMRKLVDELHDKAGGIQAVERNLDRISANLKMLEINVSDVQDLL
jgi:hypothetical protein